MNWRRRDFRKEHNFSYPWGPSPWTEWLGTSWRQPAGWTGQRGRNSTGWWWWWWWWERRTLRREDNGPWISTESAALVFPIDRSAATVSFPHLIDDFRKLLQGGAHHLVVAPQRKTLQWNSDYLEVQISRYKWQSSLRTWTPLVAITRSRAVHSLITIKIKGMLCWYFGRLGKNNNWKIIFWFHWFMVIFILFWNVFFFFLKKPSWKTFVWIKQPIKNNQNIRAYCQAKATTCFSRECSSLLTCLSYSFSSLDVRCVAALSSFFNGKKDRQWWAVGQTPANRLQPPNLQSRDLACTCAS